MAIGIVENKQILVSMISSLKTVLSLLMKQALMPMIGALAFLLLWSIAAQNIDTSLGKFPGPSAVFQQFGVLYQEHVREGEKEAAFFVRQKQRNEQRLAQDPEYVVKIRSYTGKNTFPQQILTSLVTVMSGFLLAVVIAIPLGISIGLSKSLSRAINPIIQVFKPVSPLAWLPLVTMVVSALYVTPEPMFDKAFVTSLVTVTLCCIWPMVINTSIGVATIDTDLVNVSRVLQLSALTHVRKIVLPAAVPMIFTGMRLSLGIAWMVLIAAEMLAQNPGLGKFVWDEYQNGSAESLSRILASVLVIGLIGFLLDQGMLQLQRMFSWDKTSEIR